MISFLRIRQGINWNYFCHVQHKHSLIFFFNIYLHFVAAASFGEPFLDTLGKMLFWPFSTVLILPKFCVSISLVHYQNNGNQHWRSGDSFYLSEKLTNVNPILGRGSKNALPPSGLFLGFLAWSAFSEEDWVLSWVAGSHRRQFLLVLF